MEDVIENDERGAKKISDISLRINFSLLHVLSNILNSKVGKMQYTIKNMQKVMRCLIIKIISKHVIVLIK